MFAKIRMTLKMLMFLKNRFFNQAITSPEYLRIAVHPDEDYKHELADMLEKKDAKSHNEIQDLKQKDAILQFQSNKTNTFLSILKRNGVPKRRLGSTSDALCPFVTMSDVSEYKKDITFIISSIVSNITPLFQIPFLNLLFFGC